MNEFDWYELGLRITQAVRLFPSVPEAQALESASDQNAALLALVSAASRMASESLGGNLAERINKTIESCHGRILNDHGTDENASLLLRAGIGDELIGVRRSLLQARREIPLRSRRWLTLGVEIADGSDQTWSEGRPTIRPPELNPQGPQSIDSTLVFVDPQPPHWEWQNEEAVTELVQHLKVELDDLFPPNQDLIETDCECLGGLDFRTYWGWCSLELGLLRLRQSMVSPTDDQLVTIAQIEKVVHLSAKALRNHYRPDWPEPAISHSGQRPSQWWYHDLKPVLREQFPNMQLPEVVS